MNISEVHIPSGDAQRLLAIGSGDAALLYLYIHCGNDAADASAVLNIPQDRISCAAATLRQIGLWPEEHRSLIPAGERPNYTENDVFTAMDTDHSFRMLYGEVQRQLGKTLNTEELKILLGFTRYLGMPTEVIAILVNYCRERARERGSHRMPSLRSIEKEAYAWADRGIETLEDASAYIQTRNVHNQRMAHVKHLLGISGRRLTQAEERYAENWIEMGFDDAAITLAYERTCINTGGLKWPYMNAILKKWHEAGLHNGEVIASGDRRPVRQTSDRRELDADERAAIERMMQEG